MANDTNGIYQYTESEAVPSLFSTFLNKLASSVSTRIGEIQSTLTTNIADTGWSLLVLVPGTTAPDSAARPMIRRKNGVTYVTGKFNGATGFTVPVGYRPVNELRCAALVGASGAAVAVFVVPTNGSAYSAGGADINMNHSWVAN